REWVIVMSESHGIYGTHETYGIRLILGFNAHLGTDLRQGALVARRLTRETHLAAVINHPVIEHHPIFLRQQLHQVLLDLYRIGVRRKSEPAAHAADVRVDGDAGHAERVAEDDVGRLAADAREADQFFQRVGHVAAVLLHNLTATLLDTLRLC